MNNLVFLPAHQIAQLIHDRVISSVEVIETHFAHITQHNSKLNAIVTTNIENVYRKSQAADEALAKGEIWGALHGD